MPNWRAGLIFGLAGILPAVGFAAPPPPSPDTPQARQEAERLARMPPVTPHGGIHVDHTGRKERGKASYYAPRFANRKMANGRKMNPNSNIIASKTLPLGSVAKVTNLDNGKTATVKVEDRGPFVEGRVADLAPKVADDLDLKKRGVAPVEVKPVTVPQPDGAVKLGAGAAESSPEEVRQAVTTTKELAGR